MQTAGHRAAHSQTGGVVLHPCMQWCSLHTIVYSLRAPQRASVKSDICGWVMASWRLKIVGAVRHLGFDLSGFLQFRGPGDAYCTTSMSNVNTTGQYTAELLMIQPLFLRAVLYPKFSDSGSDLHQTLGGDSQSLQLPKCLSDFRYVASFWNQSALKLIEVENRGQISHFSAPYKN